MKNICVHKDNKISFLDIPKHYACVQDGKVVVVDEQWITINADPDEPGHGQHVLIKENGDIVAGLGGNFKNLKDLGKKKGDTKEFVATLEDVRKHNAGNGPFTKLINTATDFNPVKYHTKQPSEEEIIKELGGADKTKGSCASLALAYTAQKGGMNVLDFRDGYSREFFVSSDNKANLFEKAIVGKSDRILSSTMLLLTEVDKAEVGKEFLLATGNHMAVVRKDSSGYIEYLELQSSNPKWVTMGAWFSAATKDALRSRFNIKIRKSEKRKDWKSYLYDCDKLREDENFKLALGFINTDKDKQKKGSGGGIK